MNESESIVSRAQTIAMNEQIEGGGDQLEIGRENALSIGGGKTSHSAGSLIAQVDETACIMRRK